MASTRSRPASTRPIRTKRAGAAANPERGEHALTLAGVTYRLRPSFEAVQALEDDLGLSLLEMLRKANSGALKLAEKGVIAAEMIRAGAPDGDEGDLIRAVSAERIAELIYEEGGGAVDAVLVLLLADAQLGGRTTAGEAKPAA